MIIRKAIVSDVKAIHALISCYAEIDRMLFRSIADIYENLQLFTVAVDDSDTQTSPSRLLACCALQVIWSDLAEIKSLAVDKSCANQGIGRTLVESILDEARQLGIERVFTLTLEPLFFEKLAFTLADKESLPMKVWSDCAKCPKQDRCDETALIYELK